MRQARGMRGVRGRYRSGRALAVCTVLAVAACGPGTRPGPDEAREREVAMAGSPLAAALTVRVGESAVTLTLHVTNAGRETVVLEFPTAQRGEFVVLTQEGEELWRWSEERFFAQVVGEERLEPGETWQEQVEWAARPGPGEYVAVARLTGGGAEVEERTSFVIE
jgi:hypothetical protein